MLYSVPDRLYVLPCDHRDILRGLWDTHRPLGFDDRDEWCAIAKGVVVDGLIDATQEVPAEWAGVLMDDELGEMGLERARSAGIARILPVDTGEVGPFTIQHPGGIDGHVQRVDPEVVACLIGCNPESSDYVDQLDRTRELAEWQRESTRAFLLELQVIPRPEDADGLGFGRWEQTRRPELIARAIRDLREVGFEPHVWKLQECGTDEDYSLVFDACREGGREGVRVVILGAGADTETVDSWLRLAARHDACIGFAIGRSVWAEPIEALARGEADNLAAAREISQRYRHFARTFSAARESGKAVPA